MDGLRDLLKRFERSLGRDREDRERVSEVIRTVAGIEIQPGKISFKDRTVRISTTPVKKSEIELHREEILSQIKRATGLSLDVLLYE